MCTQDLEVWREYDVDGFIIIYSITDRRSYQKAADVVGSMRSDDCQQTEELASSGLVSTLMLPKPVILVANKSDLERSRMIGKEGLFDNVVFNQSGFFKGSSNIAISKPLYR